MSDSQTRILEMLRDKKITVEEAERLLSLAGAERTEKGDLSPSAEVEKKRNSKYLRVVVTPDPEDNPDGERVNVRVPVSLIRAGMKFTSLIPSFAGEEMNDAMKKKGVNFDLRSFKPEDIEELITALSDLEVDVDDRQGKKKVRVYVE